MIDTHAHLHLPEYDGDRERVVTRNFAMGITGIVEVCISRDRWPLIDRLVKADRRIHATVGIHPHAASPSALAELRRMEVHCGRDEVVAVGETGLDTYRDYAPLEDQRALFAAQVALARETGLPLVIHCRQAFAEVFAILDREGRGRVRGVFHCFSGGLEEARETHARDFLIGLAGGVTYAPDRWRPILRYLPREALLLETDCPYLRPAPDRRGRNEPAWVFRTAEVVAELLELETDQLVEEADRNAARLFGPRLHSPHSTSSDEEG